MGILWLLSMTIICYTTQQTNAWPGGNQSATLTNKHLFENRTISTSEEIPERNSNNGSNEITREKRGTISNENNMETEFGKRGSMKFSSWGGKRSYNPEEKRSKFSSWGGKRNNEVDDDETDEFEEQKRARFSSWGGKRNDYEAEKRAKFSSWGGKRDYNDITDNKRSRFNSWAGKRMDPNDNKRAKFSSWAGKRARFNSWAGKRSDNTPLSDDKIAPFNSIEPEEDEEISEEKRAKFSSWGGKRAPDYVGIAWNTPENRLRYYSKIGEQANQENIMKLWQDLMSRKRARFSSWAGKRSDELASDNESLTRFLKPEMEEKRARFSSWAGKRNDVDMQKFSNWGEKQGNESVGDLMGDREGYPGMIVKRSVYSWNSPSIAYKRKPVFSSWGGKRSDDIHTIQARSPTMQRVLLTGVKDKSWGSLLRPIRRGPDFYAWGGKRST